MRYNHACSPVSPRRSGRTASCSGPAAGRLWRRRRSRQPAGQPVAGARRLRRRRRRLEPWDSGQGHVALYPPLPSSSRVRRGHARRHQPARAASFNCNYRYVRPSSPTCSTTPGPAPSSTTGVSRPLASVLGTLDRAAGAVAQVDDGSGNALLGRPRLRGRPWPAPTGGAAGWQSRRPVPGLHRRHHGPAEGHDVDARPTSSTAIAAFLPEGLLDAGSLEEESPSSSWPARVVMPLPPLIHAAAQWQH
ncbi:hypothetical protein HBB16_11805 [Pseudonocardia sp. MCCB 268]|nr:hypothetical protein [Pseudonocardia cytotoxica]